MGLIEEKRFAEAGERSAGGGGRAARVSEEAGGGGHGEIVGASGE